MNEERICVVDGRPLIERPVIIPQEVFTVGYKAGSLYLFYVHCKVTNSTYTREQMLEMLGATEQELNEWHKLLVDKGLLTKV